MAASDFPIWTISHILSVLTEGLGIVLALAGIAYLALALLAVGRFRPRRAASGFQPAVTVMVPAHGVPPGLYECLRSICDQDYPPFQVVFGLHAPDDSARPVIERVMAEFPHLDASLVIDGRMVGANPKMCNLANMYRDVKHDIIVMVDADVRVARDFLAASVAPFANPAIGGTTCLYVAVPEVNFASQLGAVLVNDWFVPSGLVSALIRPLEVCYGAAIAVRRVALERVGGLAGLSSAASQDFILGERLVAHGYRIALVPSMVETVMAEPNLEAQLRHQLRWNRGTRACRPIDHAFSVVTHPLPLVFLLLAWHGAASPLGFSLIATLLAARMALHLLVRHRFPAAGSPQPWLVPLEETICFVVWVMAFFVQSMRWGNRELRVAGPGRVVAVEKKPT